MNEKSESPNIDLELTDGLSIADVHAARLLRATNKKQGKTSPPWLVDLAEGRVNSATLKDTVNSVVTKNLNFPNSKVVFSTKSKAVEAAINHLKDVDVVWKVKPALLKDDAVHLIQIKGVSKFKPGAGRSNIPIIVVMNRDEAELQVPDTESAAGEESGTWDG